MVVLLPNDDDRTAIDREAASHVARVDVYLEKNESDGRWHVVARQSRTIPVTEKTALDTEIAQLGQPYDKETQDWEQTTAILARFLNPQIA